MTALSDARRFFEDKLGRDAAKTLDDFAIMDYISATHSGGWAAWCEEHPTVLHDVDLFPSINPVREVKTSEPTLLQLRAKLERAIGSQIRTHYMDEITEVVLESDYMAVILTAYEVTDTSRRVKITRVGTRIMAWKLTADGFWKQFPTVTSWDDESAHEIHKWGAINTPERLDDKLDQASLCWRPGTSKTPLDGQPTRDVADAMWEKLFGNFNDTDEVEFFQI